MHTSMINYKTIKCMQTYILVTEHEQAHDHTDRSTITVLHTHRHCIIRHKDTNIWSKLNQLCYLHNSLYSSNHYPKKGLRVTPKSTYFI